MIVNYDFDIEKSKDGYKILKIYKDDKKVYIGSKYRMRESLDKFINADKDVKDGSIFIVFGLGTGEYIKRIYKKNIKIIIFEPNLKLIEYIKENSSEYQFLIKDNIYLLNDKNEDDVYIGLKSLVNEFDINKILYRSFLNYDKVYEEQILKFNKVIKNFLNDIVIIRNTKIFFNKRWFNTLISNFKYIIKSSPVNLFKDKYKNVPAIIVSAGPSLSKNIDELYNINNDSMILSGGRTLKSLIDKNISPDLIGVVDPGEISYNLVEGYIENTKVPLLFYEGTNEKVVKDHSGKKLFFTQNDTINNIFNMDIQNLGAGGSIAHTLTVTAVFLGCNPIIFIGQDLAYTGEKYHSDIAINQFSNDKKNEVADNIKSLYVEDINGDKIRTSEVLDNFRRDLEKIIQNNKDVTFINATEGGAKIEGTIQMTVKKAIEKYKLNKNINFFKEKDNLDRIKIKNKANEILEKIIKSDEKIIMECEKALKIIRDLQSYLVINNKIKINRCLKDLDNVDNTIKENYESLDILRSIIYPIVYNILSSNKPKNDKEIIERNKYLYESILDVSKEVLDPIKEVKNDIEKMEI